jgi:hypothetical protein
MLIRSQGSGLESKEEFANVADKKLKYLKQFAPGMFFYCSVANIL